MSEGALGVIHIPKCGGFAVSEALSHVPDAHTGPGYFDRAHFGWVEPSELPPEARQLVVSPEELRAVCTTRPLVMGHFAAASLLAAGCRGLAVQVREPRARLLSLYRFWQANPEHERRAWGIWAARLVASADRPLHDFLGTRDVWPATDNQIARQLVLDRPARSRQRLRMRQRFASLTRRYDRLQRHLVVAAWSSESTDFVARVASVIAHPTPAPARANVAGDPPDKQEIDPRCQELLERLTVWDRKLLGRLISDGHLCHRTTSELDDEFAETATRLGFIVRNR